ncbi:MAG: glutamate 5-kinase [Lachnospiraceae bacterium]|nr:glutamate 5-kinase [Lachnospiraceae bacterium]
MDFSKKKRIVIKIGSNSLVHPATGRLDYIKIQRLAMELSDLRNRGMDVCLVSSGAIAVGRQMMGVDHRPDSIPQKQALASVGQARLMSIYNQYFSEYSQMTGQVLMTKNTVLDNVSRMNATRTFAELFEMGVIPIVNANDTVSTYEIEFGDNDTLSAIVCALVGADLLILLSDINGLYTSDPHTDPDAKLIPVVEKVDERILSVASAHTGSDLGTGGMETKLAAARIATSGGADMIIGNGADVGILHQIFDGEFVGTVFRANPREDFYLPDEI